jgi:hypothetical protein
LLLMAVDGDASLRCFLEGGGERSARVVGLLSGDSSRARLRVDLGVASDDFVGTGLALDKMIRNDGGFRAIRKGYARHCAGFALARLGLAN